MDDELLHHEGEQQDAGRHAGILDTVHRDAGEDVARVKQDGGERGQFVPPDELDQLVAMMLPPQIAKYPVELMHAEAAALFEEGLRGPTGRSLLAKDVAASRLHVRYLQARLDIEVELLGRGRGDLKKARFLTALVAQQHRMMTLSAELLLKLDTVPQPSFRIEADQAAILVGGAANGRNNDNG